MVAEEREEGQHPGHLRYRDGVAKPCATGSGECDVRGSHRPASSGPGASTDVTLVDLVGNASRSTRTGKGGSRATWTGSHASGQEKPNRSSVEPAAQAGQSDREQGGSDNRAPRPAVTGQRCCGPSILGTAEPRPGRDGLGRPTRGSKHARCAVTWPK
jgi:hypothetical protein